MVVSVCSAYRQMDDHEGPSLLTDLGQSLRLRAAPAAGTPTPACFVALEGGEGAGKSTQARRLQDWLAAEGYEVVLTHEPGDTEIGQKLRRIVLSPETGTMSDRTEALLYAADKAEHVDRVVLPALERGAVVVTDRYVDSTLAYQGAGRDLVDAEVERIARWATADLRPHLTVLLDLEPQAGPDPVRGARPDRGGVAGVPRAGAGDVPAAAPRPSPQHYLVVDARKPARRDRAAGSGSGSRRCSGRPPGRGRHSGSCRCGLGGRAGPDPEADPADARARPDATQQMQPVERERP